MNFLIQLIAAISAGIAAGCIAFYLMRLVSNLNFADQPDNLPHRMPLTFRLAMLFVPMFRGPVSSPSFQPWLDAISVRLWMAGYGEVITPADFAALRLVMIVFGMLICFFGVFAGYWPLWLMLGILLAFRPQLWMAYEIKNRHLSIMKALPNVLDLLTLSVESGRDLLSALRDILSRRKLDPLGEELMRTFREIQLGRKRTEALRALSLRVRQTDLTSVMNAIIQAEELGVSIAQILRIQGDMQRNKRFTLAEKLANQASVKIIFPIILCILPAVFLILMGPFVQQILRLMQ